MKKKSVLKLIPYLKSYRVWIILSIISTLITTAFTIISTYLLNKITDEVKNIEPDMFYRFLFIIIAVALGKMVFTFIEKYSTAKYSTYTIRDLRNDFTDHILKLPLYTVKKYNSGDFVSIMNTDIYAISEFIKKIPFYFCQPFLFAAALSYMLIINVKLTLACLILIPASSILFDKINKPIQKYSKKRLESIAQTNSSFSDMVNGLAILKAFNLKKILSQKYELLLKKVRDQGLNINKISAYLTPVFLALRFIPQLICPIYGGYLIIQNEMTVGGLVAFLLLIWYVFGPVERLLEFINKLRQLKPSCERIFEVLNLPVELSNKENFLIKDSQNAIIFKDVSFSYDGEEDILNNISFKIESGKTMAIVGPSGGGKSTIINLLCGFYKLDNGYIRVFGNNIENTDIYGLRSQISYVSQDSFLFPTTIFENISYGRIGASREDVLNAAKEANAHDFIIKLPNGYDTVLYEGGKNLSGGQCQRITLARAILKNAPILLLDEPTSALDLKSERLFTEALRKIRHKHTLLIIAHRLSTIEEADEILVLNKGSFCEKGTHEQLLKIDGLYKNLYLKQTASNSKKLPAVVYGEV